MKKIIPVLKLAYKTACTIIFLLMMNVFAVKANNVFNVQKDSGSVTGRWDMTIYIDNHQYPSWLEVQSSGNILVGEFVGIVGSARPVSRINFNDNKISFSVPPQWEDGKNDLSFEGELNSDSLSGTMVSADGKNYNWSAVRAPLLKRASAPVWQKPITLFNGKDLKGWHASGEQNQWIVKDGILQSPHSGSNLVTDAVFKDFKLAYRISLSRRQQQRRLFTRPL